MPIPPFDESGVLGIPEPDDDSGVPGRVAYHHLSLVPATLEEIHTRFVVETPDRETREDLWRGWMALRRELEVFGISLHTWLGGSFLTAKPNPGDIDLCIIFEAADYGSLTREDRDAFRVLTDTDFAYARFHCHLYTLANYPANHPRFIQSAVAYNYWTRVYGVDRAGKQVSMLIVSERGVYE
jgi:hypothetical protein